MPPRSYAQRLSCDLFHSDFPADTFYRFLLLPSSDVLRQYRCSCFDDPNNVR